MTVEITKETLSVYLSFCLLIAIFLLNMKFLKNIIFGAFRYAFLFFWDKIIITVFGGIAAFWNLYLHYVPKPIEQQCTGRGVLTVLLAIASAAIVIIICIFKVEELKEKALGIRR